MNVTNLLPFFRFTLNAVSSDQFPNKLSIENGFSNLIFLNLTVDRVVLKQLNQCFPISLLKELECMFSVETHLIM